jgi:hypothetical protein
MCYNCVWDKVISLRILKRFKSTTFRLMIRQQNYHESNVFSRGHQNETALKRGIDSSF